MDFLTVCKCSEVHKFGFSLYLPAPFPAKTSFMLLSFSSPAVFFLPALTCNDLLHGFVDFLTACFALLVLKPVFFPL